MLLNRTLLLLASFCCVCIACNRNPYRGTNKQYKRQVRDLAKQLVQAPLPANNTPHWVGTTNFNLRKPNIVVIHHTAQNSCTQTLQTFTKTRTQVSAHYVICRDGGVQHMLNDYLRAWHAGTGSWGNITDVNSSSIGIELDNNGTEPFAPAQVDALLVLLQQLKTNYNIPAANFVGHCDVAPGRKTDPSALFPWRLLAEKGFGLWYSDTTRVKVPKTFNDLQALRMVGYSTRDSVAARNAFSLHYLQDVSGIWTDRHKKILCALVQQL